MPATTHQSYWHETAGGMASRYPPLEQNIQVDVAIIGGGITGCATAHQLAVAGARVVLIDAARIGSGSTAASTALLMQEPDADFGELAGRYGAHTPPDQLAGLTLSLLQGCASGPEKAYRASDGQALIQIFQAIGREIAQLRVSS